jgi:hypothetical protein
LKSTADFYLKQLPTTQAAIDSIGWNAIRPIINLVIYKEKFKEYELATKSWSSCCKIVLKKKLILPAMYNLYKIYQITNSKAEAMKRQINSHFQIRYAQIINNTNLF